MITCFKSKQYTILIADSRNFPPLLSSYFRMYQFVLLIKGMALKYKKDEVFTPASKILVTLDDHEKS